MDGILMSKILEYKKEYKLRRVSKKIQKATKERVRIKSTPNSDENILLGETKFGGNPDVPNGFQWPAWNEVKLAFLLQINLSKLPKTTYDILPEKGILSFFYHPDQLTWGYDPNDLGSWRTYYFAEENLHRKVTPEYNSQYLQNPYISCSAECHVDESYPSPFSETIRNLKLWKKERDGYFEFYENHCVENPTHQLFGYPDEVQNSMELECELVTNDIDVGDISWLKHPRIKEFEKNSKDWHLLLQLDTDDNPGMMWGDMGMLYFWIKEKHLRKCNFQETWMILQCS